MISALCVLYKKIISLLQGHGDILHSSSNIFVVLLLIIGIDFYIQWEIRMEFHFLPGEYPLSQHFYSPYHTALYSNFSHKSSVCVE